MLSNVLMMIAAAQANRVVCTDQTLVAGGVTGFEEFLAEEPMLQWVHSNSLEEAMCKYTDRYGTADNLVDQTKLADDCATFCGDSIPLLIGSGTFGMNIQEISEICMRDLFEAPETNIIKDCGEAAMAVNKVEDTATELIATLDESRKRLFEVNRDLD